MKLNINNVLCLMLFLLLTFFCSCKYSSVKLSCIEENRKTIQEGEAHFQPLIAAFEQYKSDNGKYPTDIFELTPKYIEKIPEIGLSMRPQEVQDKIDDSSPNPKISSSWTYSNSEGMVGINFFINIEEICATGKISKCEYRSGDKEWICQ